MLTGPNWTLDVTVGLADIEHYIDQGRLPSRGRSRERGETTLADTPGVGTVHATQPQLDAMANKCMETRESIATGMAQLLDRIQGLSGSGMAGNANAALQNVSVQLNDGLTKILNALDDLAGKISNASSTFGVQDQDAAQEIQAAAAATGDGNVMSVLRG
jgi:uncharacterized protein YukE